MDWGFTKVVDPLGKEYQVACFAVVCHHCCSAYIEFFSSAKQENLFIGLVRAFDRFGVPEYILTDNMKSVTTGRDIDGKPLWNNEYANFMATVGFETKLCRPRHPFTKGAVERLVRFVKENFLVGRVFGTITDLNYNALQWCFDQDSRYHKAVDCIPNEKHAHCCWDELKRIEASRPLSFYLCPERIISFDGFVNYEGRRFGVPIWYRKRTCRVQRQDFTLSIYDDDMSQVLVIYDATWSRKDQFCADQYVIDQPEEYPSMPVKTKILEIEAPRPDTEKML